MSNPYIQNSIFGLHWQEKIKQTNQLIKDNPGIHRQFRTWYQNYLQRYGKAPEPPYTVRQVERLIYNQNMALAYRYKRNYNDAFAGISDAEANAAADAALRALAAKRARPTITIRKPPIIPRNRTLKLGEVKGVDTDISAGSAISATTNTNANIYGINLINQGSGSYNRIGRKTYPVSVRLTGSACFAQRVNATSGNQGNAELRVVLVWDRQPNAAAIPNFNDIFGHTNALGQETANPLDAVRYDNMARFKILKEFKIKSQLGTTTPGGGSENMTTYVCAFDEYYTFKKKATNRLETTYASTQQDPNPPLYTDISTGGLLLVYRYVYPTNMVTGDYTVTVNNGTARYRFTD